MTMHQNSQEGNDAQHGDAPRPSMSSTRGAAELPGDTPDSLTPVDSPAPQNSARAPPPQQPTNSEKAAASTPADANDVPPTRPGGDVPYIYNADIDDPNAPHNEPPPEHPPPAYTETPGQIAEDGNELGTNAVVADDGRVNITINQKSRRLSQIFAPQLQRQLTQVQNEAAPPPPYVPESLGGSPTQEPPPRMNIVIHVVGSRGDVQPFVALGKVLKDTYGHRVRLATHPTFKDFVTENGLEFFSIGGDPAELMAFMVKNPGLMPGFDTLRSGDVGKRRKGIAEILRGTWRSCIETGDGLGVDPLKQSVEEWMGVEESLPEEMKKPFVADAIIANPPSFGHIHCAEKLGIPLHVMFTMPWSPTQHFPHPLANIQDSNADPSITNYISYTLVEMLTWQGLGDLINKFRKESLGLDPISMIWAPGMLNRLKVPHTYCWSPALIPKPKDWAHHISISGFYFLSLASNYTPPPDLAAFLDAGEPPVYIGFGSIVVDDPNAMTTMIFEAVKKTGRRALVSKGWGGLGGDELGVPEGVFMLGNCPHDWLFKHVAAVVHHGGAGTTAAGISAGRPTVVVPFFGDQPFWGAMTAKAGAGPPPIPYKELTADKLADAIKEALKPESLERAQELANKIKQEQGSQNGAQSFHQMLHYDDLRCAIYPKQPAVWRLKRTQVRLSAAAATILAQEGELNFNELKLFRPREYETDEGPWDPISGGATAIIGSATTMMMGIADFPIETLKLLNIHPDTRKPKKKGKDKADGETDTTSTSADTLRTGTPANRQTSASSSATDLPEVYTPASSVAGQIPPGSSASDVNHGVSPIGSPDPMDNRSHRSLLMARAAASCHSRSPSRDGRSGVSDDGLHPVEPSQQRPGTARSQSGASQSFSDRMQAMNADAAVSTGKGLGRIVGAGFKSPMDFSLNVAKGFHNVPKLYGGEVRRVDKVDDLQSGMKTAFKELGLGMYESISGLVTDPYKGAKKEGGVGFVKGVGRGIAGVPLRFMGGIFAFPGYAMKGLYQEALKSKGAMVQNYIIAARISQGYEEALVIPASERAGIVERWKCIKKNTKRKKNVGEDQIEALHTLMQQKREKRQQAWGKMFGSRSESNPRMQPQFEPQLQHTASYSELPGTSPGDVAGQSASSLHHANTYPRRQQSSSSSSAEQHHPSVHGYHELPLTAEEEAAEAQELEAAIAASVAETSRSKASNNDATEDELIARAIRASVAELQRPAPSGDEDDEEALQRAINASIEEASKSGASREEQDKLEETLKRSMLDTKGRRVRSSDSEWDSSDTEDDADVQRILAESKELAHLQQNFPDEYKGHLSGGDQESGVVGGAESGKGDTKNAAGAADISTDSLEEEMRKAIAESEKEEQNRKFELDRQKTEEDIVLEYVKKQSMLEEEHRRRKLEGRDTAGESSGT